MTEFVVRIFDLGHSVLDTKHIRWCQNRHYSKVKPKLVVNK